jgi:FixJ family two-component response regulator
MPTGRVLLVDDDPAVRKALRRLIHGAGYHVEAFADAAGYLKARAAQPPACLVLDIRMPVMNGFELQARIAGTSHALPIVFITGHGDEDVRAQALASGAIDVLVKPIDEAVLIAAIEKALDSTSPGAEGQTRPRMG